ncbi:hypothetical protein [Thermonema sp.]|uniref:hypothetical protein n=1 Tax=Thermonema sp. TaxID=2231181 RepID=UPI00258845A1|nr:hypothetical protein [Thermonema sp.]
MTAEEADAVKRQIALNLALSLREPEVREYLKKELLKQFGGDYEVLLSMHANDNITLAGSRVMAGKVSVKDILAGKYANRLRRTNEYSIDDIEEILQKMPLLQVAMPELETADANRWDAKSLVPLVAYIPSKKEGDIIPAYDFEGNYYELSAKEEPKQPVIVISENEWTLALSKNDEAARCPEILRASAYEDEHYVYVFRDKYEEAVIACGGGGVPPSGGGSTPPNQPPVSNPSCPREGRVGVYDFVGNTKFTNMTQLRRVREWYDGKLELRTRIYYADYQIGDVLEAASKSIRVPQRYFTECKLLFTDCYTVWYNLNLRLERWDPQHWGDRICIEWSEMDNDSEAATTTHTFKLGPYTKTIQYTNGDDTMESAEVWYCDNVLGEGFLYSTGTFNFYIKQ